jgi:hypothetical protein
MGVTTATFVVSTTAGFGETIARWLMKKRSDTGD